MPNFLEGLPKEKVQLLYILGAAQAELTEQQFYQCAFECTGMNWFSFHDVVGDLEENGDIVYERRPFGACAYLTEQGKMTLAMFEKGLTYSLRESIDGYLKRIAPQFRQERELVSSDEPLPGGGMLVRLKALEGERVLLEIDLSVASLEESLTIRKNWQKHSTGLYETIYDTLTEKEK